MSLYKRLQEVQTAGAAPGTPRRDPILTELRQKIHHTLIEELGPVLYAMAEAEFDGGLPQGTCSVIHKALSAAGSMLFEELGFQGGGDNADVFTQVEAAVKQSVSKAAGNTTEAAALAEFFEANPEFYDAYLAEQQ